MTEQELKTLICQKFLDGDTDYPVGLDTNLVEEGICDSLGLVQLAGKLQDKVAGLKIRDQEITRDNLGSMRRILAFMAAKARG
jgi:acyl carrier protein